MAGENDLIEISLLSGQSQRPSLTFTPGTPANPVSVGTAGQWVVLGEGVNPVHLYLVFDGRHVHAAAAAPNAQILLAGAQVGTAWVKAPVPCELRFGGACLIMRFTPRTGNFVEEERTVHDGGALWHAAQRAVQDAVDKARQGPTPPEAPPLGAQFPPPRPAAGMPSDLGATIPMDNQLNFRDAAKTISSAPPASDDSPTTVRATVGGAPAPPPVAAQLPQEVTMIAPQPLLPRPGYSAPPAVTPAAAPRGYPATPPPPNPNAPPPAVSPGPSADTNPGTTSATNVKGYWQSASPVKKATLVLMPFALVMSYLMLQPEAPPPPPKVIAAAGAASKHAASLRDAGAAAGSTTAAATAAAATTDGGESAPGVATATSSANALSGGMAADAAAEQQAMTPAAPTDGHQETPPKVAALPAGKRTPERLALDAVAAGSFDEASRQYAALAAAHPDDPSYKEAARILREKNAQPQPR